MGGGGGAMKMFSVTNYSFLALRCARKRFWVRSGESEKREVWKSGSSPL